MRYSDKLKSFIGQKGTCIPTGSIVRFYLRESHEVTEHIDSIEEVLEDYIVINYLSDDSGPNTLTVPLDFFILSY